MENVDIEQANNNKMLVERIKGTIYGQAIGDALGLGTEGMTITKIGRASCRERV